MPIIARDDSHTYRTDGGRVLPSVTQVLQRAGLIDTTWFTDEARDRGTRVHDALVAVHAGTAPLNYPEDLAHYLYAWEQCRRDLDLRPVAWEQPTVDVVRGYAGTYDLIAREGDNPLLSPILIDFKTGEPAPWVALQLAAYARAAKTIEMPLLRRASCWLRPDATYRWQYYSDRNDEKVFLAALEVVTWKQAHS